MMAGPRIGIVMAGGSGERFWPLSQGETPKQLLKLTHPTKSMLEEAVERLEGIVDQVFISTTLKLHDPILKTAIVDAEHILAEPAKRNTLGALVWVAAELEAKGLGNASVAVVTADHYIGDGDAFRSSVSAALDLADDKHGIVTFGIRPTRPETGYGYIEVDPAQIFELENGLFGQKAAAFREKPNLETALGYLSGQRHLWNSGMFFFSIPDFKRELALAQPDAASEIGEISESLAKGDLQAAKVHFERLPNLSIDYAVMEKLETLYVLPVGFAWDDVGAWDALERTGGLDEQQNAKRGEPILIDVSDSIVVQNAPEIQVAVLGVSDLIVVSTENSVLVCHKSEAQRVREIAQRIAAQRIELSALAQKG